MLEVISDGLSGAHENMQLDREIFQSRSPHPILRLYSFSSFCATIGIFTPKDGLVNEEVCRKAGIQIAVRPTGGGLLFHENDLSFCLYVPSHVLSLIPLDVCTTVNGLILGALAPFLKDPCQTSHAIHSASRFCYAVITSFDLVWKGVKIGGGAQRRSKYGTLHQGSIFLKKPNWDTIGSVISHPADLQQMRNIVSPLSDLLATSVSEKVLRDAITQKCNEYFYNGGR
jgi:lipoate---protein ligase